MSKFERAISSLQNNSMFKQQVEKFKADVNVLRDEVNAIIDFHMQEPQRSVAKDKVNALFSGVKMVQR